jgi:hypothetical protein
MLAARSLAWLSALPAARFASPAISLTELVSNRGASGVPPWDNDGAAEDSEEGGVEGELGDFISKFRLRTEMNAWAPTLIAKKCLGMALENPTLHRAPAFNHGVLLVCLDGFSMPRRRPEIILNGGGEYL